MSTAVQQTIAYRLDQTAPMHCQICDTPMPRVTESAVIPFQQQRICPNPSCQHDNYGADAVLIGRYRD